MTARLWGVHLNGWNQIPEGYGAHFELDKAPMWLRILYRTPFVDRFAYPLLVRGGYGVLTPNPDGPVPGRAVPTGGWRVQDPATVTGGSVSPLIFQRRL